MVNNKPTTVQRNMRLRLCFNYGFAGHAIAAPAWGMQSRGFKPITVLAQSRIVSISRGSPPPKKR